MPTKKGSIPKTMPQKNTGKTKQKSSIPAGRRMQDIRHTPERIITSGREYVSDVGATTTFALTLLSVNPRNALLFPRLSAVASRYEKYHFRRLQFRFRSSSVTTDAGTMFHYMDPDPYDGPATGKLEVLNHRNSARNKLYEDSLLTIDPQDLKGERFCRTVLETTGDLRLFDVGAYRIGALAATAHNIGELEVDYEIEFISPTVESGDLVNPTIDEAYSTTNWPQFPIADVTNINAAFGDDMYLPHSDYLVPKPSPSSVAQADRVLGLTGPSEFILSLLLEGTGFSGSNPALNISNAAKISESVLAEVKQSTTSIYKEWKIVSNNALSSLSLLYFASFTFTTLTKLYLKIYPSNSATAAPVGFSLRPRKSIPTLTLNQVYQGRLPSTAVEPVERVAKSHGGTCVMLPDLSSPKVTVPSPSLPRRKYVFVCKCCLKEDSGCHCDEPDYVVRNRNALVSELSAGPAS